MSVRYASSRGEGKGRKPPFYRCYHKEGEALPIMHNHRTQIHITVLDAEVKKKITEALLCPETVRQKVAILRSKNKPIVDEQEIAETVATIQQKMKNLLRLAENSTDDETMVHLAERMNELEKQKREAQAMLYVLEDDAEERAKIEEQLQKFERWVASVRPFLTDPAYMASASYSELRLAIRILGAKVTVHPTGEEWPYRYQIDMLVPEILANAGTECQSSRGSLHNVPFYSWTYYNGGGI